MLIVMPLAGLSERFSQAGFVLPKPLIPIRGAPAIKTVLSSLGLVGRYIFILGPSTRTFHDELEKIFTDFDPHCLVLKIKNNTRGPAETCLHVAKIVKGQKTISVNCDQVMNWSGASFQKYCESSSDDGIIVTYPSKVKHNSYAKVNELSYVIEIKEKDVISDQSLNGIHFWKNGTDMISSIEELIAANDNTSGEFYLGPSYNYLIKRQKKIRAYPIGSTQHFSIGTPEDFASYLEKQ